MKSLTGVDEFCNPDVDSQRIVATGQVDLVRGGAGLITLEPLHVELQGQVTIDGMPANDDFRVTFKKAEGLPVLEWHAPVDKDGAYRVKLPYSGTLCAWAARRFPLNHVVKCETFLPGLRQADLDVQPGLIRVRLQATDASRLNEPVVLVVAKRDRRTNGPRVE